MKPALHLLLISAITTAACNNAARKTTTDSTVMEPPAAVATGDSLPAPYATDTVRNNSTVIGWPEGKTPKAPAGFTVQKFAKDLKNPRWLYVLPNGDVLVAESNKKPRSPSADRITLFRDTNADGLPDQQHIFMSRLNSPFGMLLLGDSFYVANMDGLMVYPYVSGATEIKAEGRKLVELPVGGYNNHWTRNIVASKDGKKIYISVGSGSNVAEHGMANEIRRANILEVNTDGSGEIVYASGLRNPVGMDWAPGTSTLWTVVNERDMLGDDLVPDYLTSVQRGGFYGWPYSYFGRHEDPRIPEAEKKPDLVAKSIVPELGLGAHTASLGLVFYTGGTFPDKYKGGAFIGQRGSWNRSVLSGYKVGYVPFSNGKPAGKMEDFLTGFISDVEKSEVYGRPVCVAVAKDGALLVTDDASNTIWRVAPSK